MRSADWVSISSSIPSRGKEGAMSEWRVWRQSRWFSTARCGSDRPAWTLCRMLANMWQSRVNTPRTREWAECPPGCDGVELLQASFERHVYDRHMHDAYAIGVT